MRKKDATNRIKMLIHRLTLINMYRDEFEDKLGKTELEDLINANLDEYAYLKKLLSNWPKDGDSKSESAAFSAD